MNGDVAVTRLTRRGAFDPRFGRGGTTDLDLGGDDRANALALQRDGRVVVAGRTSRRAGDTTVIRLCRDGTPDRRFGRRGRVTIDAGGSDEASAVAVRPDGARRGRRLDLPGRRHGRRPPASGRLARPAFGRRGRATVHFAGARDTALALALERDGRVVLGGSSDIQVAVARLLGGS